MRNRINAGLGLVVTLLLTMPDLVWAKIGDEVKGESKMRFALALVQGLRTYKAPGVFSDESSFSPPILRPLRVLEEQTVDQVDWIRVSRTGDESGTGWLRKKHVEVWNSRHALMPQAVAGANRRINAFCEKKGAEDFVNGTSRPCLVFMEELLSVEGDKAPFPVLDVVQIVPANNVRGGAKTFFHVLVPTTYSNIGVIKSDNSTAPTRILKSLEVILLIDATGSMSQEIAGAKAALESTITKLDRLVQQESVKPKYMVIAYRDTAGADRGCVPIESASGAEKLDFVTSERAKTFLGGLRACRGGDGPEMIWDALELVSRQSFTSGSNRVLVIVGDAPALDKTRGGKFIGERIKGGLTKDEVLKNLTIPLGTSTEFIALVAGDGTLEQTANEVVSGADFLDQRLISVGGKDKAKVTQEVEVGLFDRLAAYYRSTAEAKAAGEECRSRLEYSGDRQTALFCGRGGKDNRKIAARLADLMAGRDDDPVIVRDVWVPDSDLFTDVALIAVDESRRTESAFKRASNAIGGGRCSFVGQEVWLEVLNIILPTKVTSLGKGRSMLRAPNISKRLHDYWGVKVGKETSILSLPMREMSNLSSADCKEVHRRLSRAGSLIREYREAHTGKAFMWFPIEHLP